MFECYIQKYHIRIQKHAFFVMVLSEVIPLKKLGVTSQLEQWWLIKILLEQQMRKWNQKSSCLIFFPQLPSIFYRFCSNLYVLIVCICTCFHWFSALITNIKDLRNFSEMKQHVVASEDICCHILHSNGL